MANTRVGAWVSLVGLLASFVGCSGGTSGGGKSDDGCDHAGKHYATGDSFLAADGCNQCACDESGEVACTTRACSPDDGCTYAGKNYDVGETFPASDGCNQCTCQSDGVSCTLRACGATCDSVEAERQKELASVQQCSTAADCGQPITGSSCGCTRDLVARKDADLGHYLDLQQRASELCGAGGSTCDCPSADGFACVNDRCAWNYTTTEPDPVCQKYEANHLCVRGTATADGEVLAVGDILNVTVQSSACLSSSCDKVQAAECAITERDGFDVDASFCVATTVAPGQGCTDDCGRARAGCSFGQGLTAGEHQVRLGSIVVGFQVPTKLPRGGLCAGNQL